LFFDDYLKELNRDTVDFLNSIGYDRATLKYFGEFGRLNT